MIHQLLQSPRQQPRQQRQHGRQQARRNERRQQSASEQRKPRPHCTYDRCEILALQTTIQFPQSLLLILCVCSLLCMVDVSPNLAFCHHSSCPADCRCLASSEWVAVEYAVRVFLYPETFHSDQGKGFENELVKELRQLSFRIKENAYSRLAPSGELCFRACSQNCCPQIC